MTWKHKVIIHLLYPAESQNLEKHALSHRIFPRAFDPANICFKCGSQSMELNGKTDMLKLKQLHKATSSVGWKPRHIAANMNTEMNRNFCILAMKE